MARTGWQFHRVVKREVWHNSGSVDLRALSYHHAMSLPRALWLVLFAFFTFCFVVLLNAALDFAGGFRRIRADKNVCQRNCQPDAEAEKVAGRSQPYGPRTRSLASS